jgi:HSP20 family protein
MLDTIRRNPFDEMLAFQRQADRLFNQFWHDLPAQATEPWSAPSLQVKASDDGWRIQLPMPGIDPANVTLEIAGNTVSVRAEQPGDTADGPPTRYERTLAVPQFLDLEKLSASHRHGLLELTLPVKDSVKPRRIQIRTEAEAARQLTHA